MRTKNVWRIEFATQVYVLADSVAEALEIAKHLREDAPYPGSTATRVADVTLVDSTEETR